MKRHTMTDELPACKEFNQIVTTLRVHIPDSLDETVNKLNGLGGLLTAGHWARAAFVRAWVEPQPGYRSDLGEKSPRLTVRDFASLGIRGLSTRDAEAILGGLLGETVTPRGETSLGFQGRTKTLPPTITKKESHQAREGGNP